MKPSDIILIKTCDMYPEQYDAIDSNGNTVGYLRLRHGYFAVYCPNVDADIPVYDVHYKNNVGDFCDERERKKQLKRSRAAISAWWNERK